MSGINLLEIQEILCKCINEHYNSLAPFIPYPRNSPSQSPQTTEQEYPRDTHQDGLLERSSRALAQVAQQRQLNSRESIEDFTLQLLQFINSLIPSHNANSISKYKQKLQNAKTKERVVDNSSKAEGTHLLIKLSDKKQGYDNHEAMANLLIPCILMAGTTPFNTRVIVGFGGSEHGPIARLPVYVIASLELMRKFRDTMYIPRAGPGQGDSTDGHLVERMFQQLPTLIIRDASRAAALFNKVDPQKLAEVVPKRKALLKCFIARYAPDLVNCTIFDSDDHMPFFSADNATELDTVLNTSKECKEALNYMTRHRQNAARDGGILLYAASHVLIFQDIVPHDDVDIPDAIISLGGAAEKRFNYIREILWNANKTSKLIDSKFVSTAHVVRIIQTSGSNPPYYYSEKGDQLLPVPLNVPLLPSATLKGSTSSAIRRDMVRLLWFVRNSISNNRAKAYGEPMSEEEDYRELLSSVAFS